MKNVKVDANLKNDLPHSCGYIFKWGVGMSIYYIPLLSCNSAHVVSTQTGPISYLHDLIYDFDIFQLKFEHITYGLCSGLRERLYEIKISYYIYQSF